MKCKFASKEVSYLGHNIGHDTVCPLTDNVAAIKRFPAPKNRKNVRQFLGKVNIYRKYIPNATKLLDPLHNLLRKDREFLWDEKCQNAFENAKECLVRDPILARFLIKMLRFTSIQMRASRGWEPS